MNSQDRKTGEEMVFRLNPLFEILKSSPRRINKVFVQKERGNRRIGEIIREARAGDIPVIFVPRVKLDGMADHHQGVVAFLSAWEFTPLEKILAGVRTPLLVILDEIEDPQNLGAIIRTAECAGATGIILPEHRSAGLTEAVSTVAAGALEHMKITRVTNLARTMDDLKEKGFWFVGAEGGGKDLWYDFDYKGPVGIVLGSEGRGLRTLVRKSCDRVLSIPLMGHITSLNVSAAAAVFLFEAARQRLRASSPPPPRTPKAP